MATKKRLKNIPILHDEVKTKKTVVLTPTAWETMKVEARIRGISISELIEEFGRSLVNKKPSTEEGACIPLSWSTQSVRSNPLLFGRFPQAFDSGKG
jgi:hypothetical protein